MTLKARVLNIVLAAGDAGITSKNVLITLREQTPEINAASVRGCLARMNAYGVLIYSGIYRAT